MGVDQYPMYSEAVSEQLNMPYKIAGGILNYCRLKYLGDPAKTLENAIPSRIRYPGMVRGQILLV